MYAPVYHYGPRWPTTVDVVAERAEVAELVKAFGEQISYGSDVLATVSPKKRSVFGELTKRPRQAAIHLEAVPNPHTLPRERFGGLRQAIEDRDLSLEAIRAFPRTPDDSAG